MEGVAGTSTPTQCSVYFQVSGVEDDRKKIGIEVYVVKKTTGRRGEIRVEAYMPKKITNNLPLHSISLRLKWDLLSDLKLAYSDFRTPAHIDFLLVAEVFTSRLCDGRQTGPQDTPSTINTGLGWVLFGKIEGSDVVDMVNLIVEQDVLKELTGSRRSYVALLYC